MSSSLRKQVLDTTRLLLDAVEKLEVTNAVTG